MNWPDAQTLFSKVALPSEYALAYLVSDDVPSVSSMIAQWYPDIEVGMESVHLKPEFYQNEVQLGGAERDVLGIVVRHRRDGIIALLTLVRNREARSLSTRIGVLHPEHRVGALALMGPLLLERCARLMNAGVAHYFATLKSKHQQVIAERRGFSLVGIVPAHDLDMVRQGEARRVYEALYAKVLVETHAVEIPSASHLTTRTRRVFEELFPDTQLQ